MERTAWLNEQEMRAWRAMITTTNALRATLDAELQEAHGLTAAEYEVLVILSEAENGLVRMTDLAERLHMSPSGCTRRIDQMVKRGLVRREKCPTDRRVSYSAFTPAGRRLLEEAAPTHVRGVREHFIDRLTERQLANITAAFTAVATTRTA